MSLIHCCLLKSICNNYKNFCHNNLVSILTVMASPTQWTWVWASSRSWWWTGKPGMLQSTGSQRVGHNWVTELNCMGILEPSSYIYFIILAQRLFCTICLSASWQTSYAWMISTEFFSISFLKETFYEMFSVQSRTKQKMQFPYLPSPACNMHSLSHYQHVPSEWYICYNWWIYTDTSLSKKSIVYVRILSCFIHSMGLDKCIMTCIHPYSITEYSLT